MCGHPYVALDPSHSSSFSEVPSDIGSGQDRSGLKLHKFPKSIANIACVITLIGGVFSVYAFKIMNKIWAPVCGDQLNPLCAPRPFDGPYTQGFMMFGSMTFILVIHGIDVLINRCDGYVPFLDFVTDASVYRKKPGHWWWWSVSAMCDLAGSLMCNAALTLTYASTVTMLRNFMVVIAALFQLFLIRKALRIHEWLGVMVLTSAMICTAIPAITHPEGGSTADSQRALMGIALSLVGTTMHSFHVIFDEYLFRKGYYSPMKAVGCQGAFGLCALLILSPLLSFLGAESFRASFYQLSCDLRLFVTAVAYCIAAVAFNGSGLAVTSLVGGLMRVIIVALRAPVTWILDLSLGWIEFDGFSMTGVVLFLLGFAFYVRLWSASVMPEFHKAMSQPVHMLCTKPELDEAYDVSQEIVIGD
eukprot:Blabericola_migrator_1__2592@NODE_1731_length_3907_cov_108_722917_g1118_i0_p2_GENE_NODE_1731_length_3907_cov_108_722917_g1118_i0NODE_1731_length_3907_cov_108_722917_g1118_i0_p2_ORF_typecomplete_len417_score56_33SLC35F/PF06027_12/2_7e20Nuc_sug_transp/PF04142_15/2_1e16CRTlike/PF08627_10/2_5e03CRTlike/PF08627_10/3_3e17UAA/PF08449_11/1e15PUNUT/PF16913_5/5_3e12TPT/PF03151_16/3_6e03TPT/PF03151_16/5_6e11EamA/PF00892_20/4_9e05EamA/PF00892_20/1_1Mg_trans_NIPA/PF05653_14/0_16Phage_holin_1/PF04531_13/5e03P